MRWNAKKAEIDRALMFRIVRRLIAERADCQAIDDYIAALPDGLTGSDKRAAQSFSERMCMQDEEWDHLRLLSKTLEVRASEAWPR